MTKHYPIGIIIQVMTHIFDAKPSQANTLYTPSYERFRSRLKRVGLGVLLATGLAFTFGPKIVDAVSTPNTPEFQPGDPGTETLTKQPEDRARLVAAERADEAGMTVDELTDELMLQTHPDRDGTPKFADGDQYTVPTTAPPEAPSHSGE